MKKKTTARTNAEENKSAKKPGAIDAEESKSAKKPGATDAAESESAKKPGATDAAESESAKKPGAIKKGDIFLVLAVLLTAGILAAVLWLVPGTGAAVEVTVDGKRIAVYPLSQEVEVVIRGYDGGENVLTVADGKARVISADCPDLICVHHGAISRPGQSIICLPHRVTVTVIGGQTDIDAEV